MRSAFSLRKHRGPCRFHSDHLDLRLLTLKILADTRQGSACADSCHKEVNLSICVIPDLRAGCCSVCSRVCRIRELPRNVASRNLLCKLIRLRNGTLHSFRAFCQDNLRSISLQDISSLDTHRLRHGEDDSVPLCRCDRSQPDPGIAGGRLDDDRPLLQQSLLLGILNHRLCDTILDRACRVKILELCQDLCLKAKLLLDIDKLHKRCVSDQLQCSLVNLSHL